MVRNWFGGTNKGGIRGSKIIIKVSESDEDQRFYKII